MAFARDKGFKIMDSEITKIVNKNGMVISRMPDWAKQIIMEVAFSEHSDDYGAAIAQFTREAMEYRALKQKFFAGDINVKLLLEDKNKKENDIRFANGKQLNKGGKK